MVPVTLPWRKRNRKLCPENLRWEDNDLCAFRWKALRRRRKTLTRTRSCANETSSLVRLFFGLLSYDRKVAADDEIWLNDDLAISRVAYLVVANVQINPASHQFITECLCIISESKESSWRKKGIFMHNKETLMRFITLEWNLSRALIHLDANLKLRKIEIYSWKEMW